MTTALSILAALVLLSVLVVVHELGHFLAGRALGFSILEFAVGMGPKLLSKKKNGIEYSLRALPIGGMCRFKARIRKLRTNVLLTRRKFGSVSLLSLPARL